MENIPKFFLIAGFVSQISFANQNICQIKFYEKIYFTGEKSSIALSDIIDSTNCPVDLQNKIAKVVLNSQGPLRSSYLKEASESPSLEIFPEKFELISLQNLIKLPPNWLWENFKLLNGQKIFRGGEVSINCNTCTSLGKKAIEIKIDKSTFWANGDLKMMAPVHISKSIISSNKEPLSAADFETVNRPITNPDEYFSPLNEIKFYKLNLDLAEGTPLKKSNLRKIDLIKPGMPVNLILLSNGILIKGMGIPMSGGKIDEVIKVKNQKTNNILFGKVVGENTLSVDL